MSDQHELAYQRILDGIELRLVQLCEKDHVTMVFVLDGMWEWFRTAHPEAHTKFKAAEDRIDELWIEGRTDAEALNAFNAQLRIYRDGAYWVMEKHLAHKKELEAKTRTEAATAGRQESMAI